MTLSAGTTLGPYEVLSSLGAGGMGEVYRARDSRLDREVAIKVLPEAVAGDTERLARFEREAKALAALNHPNVATLYGLESVVAKPPGEEAAEPSSIPILVMELVEGPTLADRIAQGPLAWEEAARIFLDIAQGLEAAHERGIVHRDLKPANVKLGRADSSGATRAKVLDFGLAKAMEADSTSGSSAPGLTQSPTLTLAATMRGEVMGTAGYMAPEQARGSSVDKRADVWAFGVCLWEALTGREVFGGDTISDKLASVLKDEPDWDDLPAGLPPALVTLLHRCLEKPAGQRLRDIGEARIVLSGLLANPERAVVASGADGSAKPGVPGTVVAAVVLASLLVGGGLAWLATSRRGRVLATTAAPIPMRFSIGGSDGGGLEDVGSLAISPDGRNVVVAGRGTGSGDAGDTPLRLRPLDAFDEETRVLAGTEGALYPFFSPDGEWIGFFRGGGGRRTLSRVNVASGAIVPITRSPHPGYKADWGDDGRIVLGEQRGGLARVLEGGDGTEQLLEPDTSLDEVAQVHPDVLPGGRGIVFTAIGAEGRSRVAVWDAATGDVRSLVLNGGQARVLASGYLLYGEEGALYVVPFDLDRLEVSGDARVLATDLSMGSIGEALFDVSRNGTVVYLPGASLAAARLRLVWLDPKTGEVDEVVAEGDFRQPRIEPDGQRWVVINGNALEVYERGSPLPVRFEEKGLMLLGQPVFTPAGDGVIFTSSLTQVPTDLRQWELHGRQRVVDLPVEAGVGAMAVEMDARRGELLFATGKRGTGSGTGGGTDSDLWVMPLDTGTSQGSARPLLDAAGEFESYARLSPQGDLLAYWVGEGLAAPGTIWVADYPQMERRLPVAEESFSAGFAWAPDGRLWIDDHKRYTMVAFSFEREPELRVAAVEDVFGDTGRFWGTTRGFDIAPDGRILTVEGVRDEMNRSGRLKVMVGWMPPEGRSGSGEE